MHAYHILGPCRFLPPRALSRSSERSRSGSCRVGGSRLPQTAEGPTIKHVNNKYWILIIKTAEGPTHAPGGIAGHPDPAGGRLRLRRGARPRPAPGSALPPGGNHLSDTTSNACFFKRGESCGEYCSEQTRRKAHKRRGRIRQVALDKSVLPAARFPPRRSRSRSGGGDYPPAGASPARNRLTPCGF